MIRGYRVWDKTRNEYLSKEFVETFQFRLFKSDFYIFEQYTGLRDKNGEDIYEGDIINMSNLKTLVYFDKINASFRLKSTLDDYALTIDKVQRLEVIGNINENKELLE